ncbi:MAG: hypothetical protein BWX86_02969 [Verrucomicrobia bacterium ADurb.Bin122]|nr:MAG: hypothetical protein BWX86_02969 [Verrucomicrobia bacterium ADurb.Bin122]
MLLLLLLLLADLLVGLLGKGLRDVGLEEGGADGVELGLELVDVGVQAAFEDVVDRAELELGAEAAAEFLGVVAKFALGHAGDAAQGEVELVGAEARGAGEILRE